MKAHASRDMVKWTSLLLRKMQRSSKFSGIRILEAKKQQWKDGSKRTEYSSYKKVEMKRVEKVRRTKRKGINWLYHATSLTDSD